MNTWQEFSPPNAGYVVELYERYLRDPESVDPATRAFFAYWTPPPPEAPAIAAAEKPVPAVAAAAIAGTAALAQAIRARGHTAAHLNPLDLPPKGDPSLDPAAHGLSPEILASLPPSVVGGPQSLGASNALEAIENLRRLYSSTTGYEFAHIENAEERNWLYNAVEAEVYCLPCEPMDERAVLARLTEVEAFERFLLRNFPGQIWFSIQGNDMLVPLLDELIGCSAESNNYEVIIGMAHRGRLNVLAHVLGKPYEQLLAQFRGAAPHPEHAPSGGSYDGWTGDVKYHIGARKAYRKGDVVSVIVTLAPNPSHLEAIDPVLEGMARASDDKRDVPGKPIFNRDAALPVMIHGDAAFPGEGIVAETLNLARLPGYRVGGTIHVILNNQLGFTTEPEEGRSTLYASDLAKGFDIPIVHVNADDPKACIAAMRLAHAYRQQFHQDFMIDLIGYRRYGHNESDEPSFTQPLMYEKIRTHPTVRELWARELDRLGLVPLEEAEEMYRAALDRLQKIRNAMMAQPAVEEAQPEETPRPPERAETADTAVPADKLQALNEELHNLPEGFTPNPKLERVLERRETALGPDGLIDWAQAELLAFASILAEGIPIRLTGQDTVRGTFSQRHLVLHDAKTGATYSPLQSIPAAQASFAVYDSPLSENATLGFEYGYSIKATDALVLWEAQFGDFINGAQVMVDQFVVSGRAKWDERPSLVLLLPHGSEGQGPEHSSARPERFLELAADNNLYVDNPSTAAQYFHLLRRQAAFLQGSARPMVVLTPKSLLRNPKAAATLKDLAEGTFRPVIDDESAQDRGAIRRLILCSGKIYYELAASETRAKAERTAIARMEELYPFPTEALRALLASYPALDELVWVQEEPRNMGVWRYIAPKLGGLLGSRVSLIYVGRPERASPAEGSAELHALEQEHIVETAFGVLDRERQTVRGLRHGS